MRPVTGPLIRRLQLWSRRLLFALACLQVVAPSVAAVADGWRMDERTPFAHVEEPGAVGCVMVHDGDCVLCALASGVDGRPSCAPPVLLAVAASQRPRSARVAVAHETQRRDHASRAPPIQLG